VGIPKKPENKKGKDKGEKKEEVVECCKKEALWKSVKKRGNKWETEIVSYRGGPLGKKKDTVKSKARTKERGPKDHEEVGG